MAVAEAGARKSDHLVRIALVGIVVLGAALRAWSLDYGLPGVFNMDERPILDRALTFAKGDLNPHNFLYPTLHLYALFAWEGGYFVLGRLLGWFPSLSAFQSAFFVDPSGHVLAGRVLTTVAGTATIPVVFLFGRRLFGASSGLAAALFLAVAPLAVRDAHYIKLDVPVTFWAAWVHATLALIVGDPPRATRRTIWLAAGFLAGLGLSTQYYAAPLAAAFVAAAASFDWRVRHWKVPATRLLLAAGAVLAGFVAGSPFFFAESSAVARDFAELHAVDIERAVRGGLFSSLGSYAHLLVLGVGWPVAVLAAAGVVLAARSDWRRALFVVAFPVVFLVAIANTFPASRYLNIVLPSVVVAAGYAVVRLAALARGTAAPIAVAISTAAAIPGAIDAVRWDVFFGRPDTRTLAAEYVERAIPSGTTLLVQPYSAPLRQSRDALVEALRARLGSERAAPLKFRLLLASTPLSSPSYRLLYVGEGSKGGPPADVDKLYLSPRVFDAKVGLRPAVQAGVRLVILTRYGATPRALEPLEAELGRSAQKVATFSPYRAGVDPAQTDAVPFKHNGNTWLHRDLERPGPVVEIWRIN